MRAVRGMAALAVATTVALLVPAAPAADAAPGAGAWPAAVSGAGNSATGLTATGKPAPWPRQSIPRTGSLPSMQVPGARQAVAAASAASQQAARSGRPVPVAASTTETSTVTAEPGGAFMLREYVLPVRVRQGRRWVPVSTSLRRGPGGLVPGAVPGDSVAISAGGPGPLVTLRAGRSRLSVWWPGRLPAPAVAGSSARFAVLPGVDLVVTATSAQTGGVSMALEVRAAAARDPELAHLVLPVRVTGGRLRPAQGGLAAPVRGAGVFGLSAGQMWDSGRLAAGWPHARLAAAAALARSAGAVLAGPGSGPGGPVAPAAGSRVAPVRTGLADGGRGVSLAPDAAMLASRSTRFPVYISASVGLQAVASQDGPAAVGDAGVSPPDHNFQGLKQDYDEVKSAGPCQTAKDEDTNHYWSLGVGYDGYGDCVSGGQVYNGVVYAYYQLGIPSQIWDSTISTASSQPSTFNAEETWSASCSTAYAPGVTLSQARTINGGTDWQNVSASSSKGVTGIATVTAGPDTNPGNTDTNCGGSSSPVSDSNCNPAATGPGSCPNDLPLAWKFPVGSGSVIQNAADEHWRHITVRLWEEKYGNYNDSGDQNDLYWRRFALNPFLQIYYDHTPDNPYGGEISDGGAYKSCSGASVPHVGHLDSNLMLQERFSDPDGDEMDGTFEYKAGSGSWVTPGSGQPTDIGSGTEGRYALSDSWVNGLADGTEVYFQADASDGTLTSGWSPECHFKAYPTPPPEPTVTGPGSPTNCPAGTPSATIVPSCQVSFTITSNDTSKDPAAEFVFGLDQVPADSGPPPGEVVTLNGKTSATVEVTVPSPGPHAFYAYTLDTGGNDSPTTDPLTFTANADSWPAPFPSFSAALTAGEPFDNTMISNSFSVPAGSLGSGSADADGVGNSIDEAALKAAGWQPGGTITVDGATFTLPDFGTTSSGPDNILAAGQTIDLPAGSQGNTLVFLATSTDADATAPLARDLPQDDYTAPYVPASSPDTGLECDTWQSDQGDCQLPSGSITYASGSGAVPESYFLTVPDWVNGPETIAPLVMPDEMRSSGTSTAHLPAIYAFAVPLNPDAQVASVTLPDIGDSVGGSEGGVAALHILGIATANTTTATPGTTEGGLSGGQTWTGGWFSPTEDPFQSWGTSNTGWDNQTFRTTAQVSVGGGTVRLRLSDALGWITGTGPLTIDAVTVGEPAGGAAQVPGTVTAATFGPAGSTTVNIPEGGDVYSNPVNLAGFALSPGGKLDVSLYVSGPYDYLPEHTYCSACTTYVSAFGSGDKTADTTGTPFGTAGGYTAEGTFSNILTGVDVQTAGVPTAVVLGDNVTDGVLAGNSATPAPGLPQLSDDLAAAEIAAGGGPGGGPQFGVVSAGIQSNDLDSDKAGANDISGVSSGGGVSALTRLASDVLAEPNVGTVLVDEGLEDLLQGEQFDAAAVSSELADAYPELFKQLAGWGLTVIGGSLPPCSGYGPGGIGEGTNTCTTGSDTTVDGGRVAVNAFLEDQLGFQSPVPCPVSLIAVSCNYFADLDGAVSNGATPEALQPAFDTGDHVNLTAAGYQAITSAVPLDLLTPAVPPDY